MRTVVFSVLSFVVAWLLAAAFRAEPQTQPGAGGFDDPHQAHGAEAGAEAGTDSRPGASGVSEAHTGPVLDAQPGAAEQAERAERLEWVRRLVTKRYRYQQQDDTAQVPAALERGVADGALDHVEQAARNYGAWLSGYVDRRETVGTLDDPPVITVQLRGTATVRALERDRRIEFSNEPIDLSSAPSYDEAVRAYVRSGVVPIDRVFVFERIEVVARIGAVDAPTPGMRKGALEIRVGGTRVFQRKGELEIRGRLLGRSSPVRPPAGNPALEVTVRQGVASVVAHGRLVSREEADDLRYQAFRWAPEGDDGLLGDEPVTLQVLAEHGGANERSVRLDGSMSGIGAARDSSLWDPDLDLRTNRTPAAWAEGVGAVPEGKLFRITRIDWRARVDPRQSQHSDLRLRFKNEDLVKHSAKTDGEFGSGTWNGSIDVRPGEERRFALVGRYFAMGEAVITGAVVQDTK